MPFSHHSHSGQFCPGHAANSLEEVIQTAIRRGFRVFCLSEHMPRGELDLYPEEVEAGTTPAGMVVNETAYVHEAIRLREKYASQIQILIGFESDWIREESFDLIQRSLSSHPFEFFVGSVHHMHTIPIDFDRPMYEQARVKAGGTDELLFQDYFDAQLDMLQRLRPPVVGHFDLIRLKSDTPDVDFRVYPGVWERIIRNLEFIASYGGLMEVNSAALRKGMRDPYPTHEISREFLARKGRFCLSDDSHGVEQVGLNFRRVLDFLGRVGVTELYYLELREEEDGPDARFPRTGIRSLGIESVDSL